MLFKEPYITLATQTAGQNEDTHVTEPWDFSHLEINLKEQSITDMEMNGQTIALECQRSVPDMTRLKLDGKEVANFDNVFSTADTSMQGTGRDARNLQMETQSSICGLEETKSTGREHFPRHN